MLIGRYDDPTPRTRVDVDMRIDAALADEAQRGEAFEQRLADVRTLANQQWDLPSALNYGAHAGGQRSVPTDDHPTEPFGDHRSLFLNLAHASRARWERSRL